MATITRQAYADMYGPTTGDRIRLADTELVIEIDVSAAKKARLLSVTSPRFFSGVPAAIC